MTPKKLTWRELKDREIALQSIICDTLWMAQRYTTGRKSYAVGLFNDALYNAKRLINDEKIKDITVAKEGSNFDGVD